jgi:hypothetical protein
MKRWILAALLLLAAASAGVYVFSTQIITTTLSWLAAREGVSVHDLRIQRVGTRSMLIQRVVADVDDVSIRAADVEINYDLTRMGGIQVLTAVNVDALQVRVAQTSGARTGSDGVAAQPVAIPNELDLLVAFGALPEVSVRHFQVEIDDPAFVGTGSLDLDRTRASFDLVGVAPEVARGIRVDGVIRPDRSVDLSFSDGTPRPFLQVQATTVDEQVDAKGSVELSGYPLELISGLLDLPVGSGRLRGNLVTNFDIDDLISTPENLKVAGDFVLDWRVEDVQVDALSGTFDGSIANVVTTVSAGVVSVPAADMQFNIGSDLNVQYGDSRLNLGPGLTSSVLLSDGVAVQTEFVGVDIALGEDATTLKADATFELSVNELASRGSVSASVSLTGDQVEADVDIVVAQLKLPVHVSYNIETGSGRFVGNSQTRANRLFDALIVDWPYDADIASGDVNVDLRGILHSAEVSGDVVVELIDAAVSFGEYELNTANAKLDFGFTSAGVILRPSKVSAGVVDVGVPIQDIEAEVAWQEDVVDLHRARFDVLGGSVSVAPTRYDLADGSAIVEMTVADVDLAEVLALEGEEIRGSGRLSGSLPVRIQNGAVSISDGQIQASEAGGTIELSPTLGVATGQPGIDFALQALADFRYTALTAVADLVHNGDLQLAVSLQGSNPAVEKGRPIHYNLNISENIFSLMQALSAQSGITTDIERRVLGEKANEPDIDSE